MMVEFRYLGLSSYQFTEHHCTVIPAERHVAEVQSSHVVHSRTGRGRMQGDCGLRRKLFTVWGRGRNLHVQAWDTGHSCPASV